MIDQWPDDLIDLLVSPKQTDPVAIWIGAGLGNELGYPLTTPLVDRLVQECSDAHCNAADIEVARDYLRKNNYRMAADQCWDTLNDASRFRQVLLEAFSSMKEKDSGLRACEDILATPFDAYVTTNYNISLSAVSRRLAKGDPVYKLAADNIGPKVDPTRLRVRCIHYIHSNITQTDSIVLRETDFLSAYADESPLPLFLENLFSTHHLLFFGTDARDEDIMWILRRMQRVFAESPRRVRYILFAITAQGTPRVHAIQRTYGIRPLWYTVQYRAVPAQDVMSRHIKDHSRLYELLNDLRIKTQGRWLRQGK